MTALHELRAIPLFTELNDEELTHLHGALRERRAPRGSYIVYVEDPGPSMMFLVEGRAKVNLLSNDGKEVVLAHLADGDFFGEIALLTGEDRSANVVALTDCKLLVLNAEDFSRHISRFSGLAHAMLKELALRLRSATLKIGDLALYDVYRRVARTLRSMGEKRRVADKDVWVIEERPTHQELASMVGTSREMVTRALKGLEEDRCIVIDGKRIELFKIPN